MTLRHLSVSLRDLGEGLATWLYLIGVVVAALVMAALVAAGPAPAHDSWISRGDYRNGAGEWCCGDYDCKSYGAAQSTATGWLLDGELVPYDEALPVVPPDGEVTVCRRPDGTRRCVYGVKPGL